MRLANNQLSKKTKELESKTRELNRKSRALLARNVEYDILLTKRNRDLNNKNISDTRFYASNKINFSIKEKGKQLLLDYLQNNNDSIRYPNALKALNNIAVAVDTAARDPFTALKMVKRIFEIDSNEIVQQLALGIINKNLLYKQKISSIDDQDVYSNFFTISRDKGQFVFNTDLDIIQGTCLIIPTVLKSPTSIDIAINGKGKILLTPHPPQMHLCICLT